MDQLHNLPPGGGWSLGQLYVHLIRDAHFYVEQINICISNNDHQQESASPEAQVMFRNNAFPDARIAGDPANAFLPQPHSKEELKDGLLQVKTLLEHAAKQIAASTYHGKTRHPGLLYFSAEEWLQFANMHFRHHERQRRRIEGAH
jgi:hypothetical protein